jgi:hypothetical protein
MYKQLFNSAPIPMVVTDVTGKVKLINEHAVNLLDDKALSPDIVNLCDFIYKSFLKEYLEITDCYSFDEFLEFYETEHRHLLKGKGGTPVYADMKLVKLTVDGEALFMWTFDTIEISKRLSHDLKERVKEQRSLLQVIEILFQAPDIHTGLERSLEPVRNGWRFPKATGVRIKLESGEEFATDNFQKTAWTLTAAIASASNHYGFIEVCYVEEVPAYEGAIFLYEEKQLVTMHGKLLGMFTEHWHAIDKIKKGASLLGKITSQVPGNTYQFEISPECDTKILFLGRGAEAYNYPADQTDLNIKIIYEADRERFRDALAMACKTKNFLNLHYRVQLNGTVRWRWLRAVPEENSEEGKTIWYGATQDITPLVDYMTSIEQMLFDISHVIRRPIVNILGISKFIADTELPEDELRALVADLLKASRQLDVSIRQLKTLYIDQKRALKGDFTIDFASLVDRREHFFDD